MEIEFALNIVLEYILSNKGEIYRINGDGKDNNFEGLLSLLKINENELIELCKILEEDNYVKIEFIERNRSHFDGKIANIKITLKGNYFMKTNGYVGQLERNEKNTVLERKNEKYLRYGAIFAAIGTCLYLIWDILKWVKEHYPLFPHF